MATFSCHNAVFKFLLASTQNTGVYSMELLSPLFCSNAVVALMEDGMHLPTRVLLLIYFLAYASVSIALCQCDYDLNGVGYPRNGADCPYRGGNSNGNNTTIFKTNTININAAAQSLELKRQQEEKKHEEDVKNAAEDDREGLEAEVNGSWEDAVNKFMDALDLDPDNESIAEHLEHAKAQLDIQVSADELRAMNARIEAAFQNSRIKAQNRRREIEETNKKLHDLNEQINSMSTIHKAGIAAVSDQSAKCIFDGIDACALKPVALVQVGAGEPSVPPEVARYIASIPLKVRKDPTVDGEIKNYEHQAHIRSIVQNQLVEDMKAIKPNSNDEHDKFKMMTDTGNLKVAKNEEAESKAKVSFAIEQIHLQPSTKTKEPPSPVTNNTAQ